MKAQDHNQSRENAYVCRRMPAEIEAALKERFVVKLNESDQLTDSATIIELGNGAGVLLVTATDRSTAP